MKSCPTCGMAAEDRASFCPCCGSSFVVSTAPDQTPATPIPQKTITSQETQPKPAVKTAPPPPFFEEEKKKGGHALPIILITLLTAVAVTLCALWVTGGLAAMLGKDNGNNSTSADNGNTKPSFTLHQLQKTAATYSDGLEITTEQYLAYLYLEFENIYYTQGLCQYEACGIDPWTMKFPYGDSGEELLLSDYIVRTTQDTIKQQIVLQQIMEYYHISWIEEDKAALEQSLSMMEKDAFIDLGFSNESYAYALKNVSLNERSTFYGLYKTGGTRGISESELRGYFVNNYLSYQMFSIPLTDNNGKLLATDSLAYQWLVERMAVYQTVCQQQGFEAAYELYEKDQTTIRSLKNGNANVSLHTTVTIPTTGGTAPTNGDEDEHEHDHRQDVDAVHMDEALAHAISNLPYNQPTVVEYQTDDYRPTIALVERFSIYSDPSVYENAVESIIYEMRYKAFDQEVKQAMDSLVITFDEKVIAAAKPEIFLLYRENV